LRPEELKKFFEALNSEEVTSTTRDLIQLLLFTGARRSNVLSMQWGELDLTQNTWIIPASKSKNAESLHIPLVAAAVEILERRKRDASSVFVFPSTGRTGHLMDPKKVWAALLKKAGLSNVRLHDLRRTCGSYQAACGSSLTVIGKSLGHKNVATTAIYSRLTLDPVRDSMEKGAAAMMVAVNAPEKIIKMDDGL
jgi:integrase